MEYSTKDISSQLLEEIKSAIQSVHYGSIEIYISDSNITQITTRTIKKTSTTVRSKKKSKKEEPSGKSKKYMVNNVANFGTADQS